MAREHVYVIIMCFSVLPYSLMDNIYPSLHPLFVADPILLHVFIYICRKEEYCSLFKKIPAYLSLTFLSQVQKLTSSEVSGYGW